MFSKKKNDEYVFQSYPFPAFTSSSQCRFAKKFITSLETNQPQIWEKSNFLPYHHLKNLYSFRKAKVLITVLTVYILFYYALMKIVLHYDLYLVYKCNKFKNHLRDIQPSKDQNFRNTQPQKKICWFL